MPRGAIRIAPSILAANLARLGEQVAEAERCGADTIMKPKMTMQLGMIGLGRMGAAYAEGLGVLRAADAGKRQTEADAETTPLRDPEHYQFELNLADIAEVWRGVV